MVLARTMRSSNSSGFWVGYPNLSFDILFKDGIGQTSVAPFIIPFIR